MSSPASASTTGVDTNLLVRLLVADDALQAQRARNVFATGDVLVLKTVLLETEWVLRSAYQIPSEKISQAFRKLSETAGVRLDDPSGIERALELYEAGFDFADALHLSTCVEKAGRFATFDKKFQKQAQSLNDLPEVFTP